jgi:hypothetical protein
MFEHAGGCHEVQLRLPNGKPYDPSGHNTSFLTGGLMDLYGENSENVAEAKKMVV